MPRRIVNIAPTRTPIFLKEWLAYRNMTQEKLADEIGTTKSVISKIGTGKQRYSQIWLENFAYALNCGVHELFQEPGSNEREIDGAMTNPSSETLQSNDDGEKDLHSYAADTVDERIRTDGKRVTLAERNKRVEEEYFRLKELTESGLLASDS